jgi:hypothetical protein
MRCKDRVYIISKEVFGTFVGYLENNKVKVFIDGDEYQLHKDDVVSQAESFKYRTL